MDCEWNRKEIDAKRLESFGKQVGSKNDNGALVVPDIIVDRRGTATNLLVIEAKVTSNEDACTRSASCICDRCKLRAYKKDIGYTYAFYVVFPVDKTLEEFSDALTSQCVEAI